MANRGPTPDAFRNRITARYSIPAPYPQPRGCERLSRMSELLPSDEVPVMLTAVRRTKPESAVVTAQSRLKADLALRRREMRPFLLSYRAKFGFGPADDDQFLLRYFDTHWKDDDKIKWVWLYGRRMLSRDFAVRWDRFERVDILAGHFVSCAANGQWSLPEIPPLSEQEQHRLQSTGEIAWDTGLFLVSVIGLLICLIVGFMAGPAIGLIWVALGVAAGVSSHRNFRREVRGRSD
jgi:hypothetical protein